MASLVPAMRAADLKASGVPLAEIGMTLADEGWLTGGGRDLWTESSVRSALRVARYGQAQAAWQHGALEYDPAAKVVRWQGAQVELTGRELALLEAFLTQPQRVLSKAHLLEKLYDWSGTEPESNALEVHIHHLRRKIDPNIVRTVRGVGYALGSGEPAA